MIGLPVNAYWKECLAFTRLETADINILAEHYMRFVPLFNDGVFWAAMWELRVDRSDLVRVPRTTDQWVQRARGVRLAALWLCGRTAADMQPGAPVSLVWKPLLEANPNDGVWAHRGVEQRWANHTGDNGAFQHQAKKM